MMPLPDKNTSVFPLGHIDRANWKRVRLGDLVARQTISMGRGNVISKEAIESDPGAYPVFSSSATGDGIIGYYARYMFDDERISWSIDGGGRFFYHPASRYSVTNVSGWIKVHKPAEINTRYLYLALDAEWQKKHFDYQTKAHPSVIKNEYIIAYPDFDTQNKIAAVITSCDDYITAIQSLIAKYEAIKKATVNLLLRLSGDCPSVRLGDVAKIFRGGSPRPIQNYITEESTGINWIKIGDVATDAKYIKHTAEKIKPTGVQMSRQVKAGDFILSNSMSFGRPYILKIDGCIHDGWLAIQDYQETFDVDYLYYLLGSDFVLAQYQTNAAGSSVKNLNKEIVSNIILPQTPIPEQHMIANQIATIDNALNDCRAQLAKAQNLKNGLMSYFFG